MIIRRAAEAIREQNWFTVIIEIFIVVVGIFLGLQVDDWNQTRKANIENQLFMTQLDEDIEEVLSNVDSAILQHQRFIDWGKLAMRYLDGEDILAEHQTEIENAFARMHQLPTPQLLTGHLNTMLSGGAGQIVTDQITQRKLVTLASNLGSSIDVYRHIENRITELTAINRRMVGFAIPDDDEVSIAYDGEALRQSAEFKIAMQNTVVFHRNALRFLKAIINILKQHQESSTDLEVDQ